MATQINMQYNPYLPRLTVLIDGKQPSEYSRLTQFADEDIWKWHSEILNVLYNEVRDEFFVIFTGTEWSIDIMKFECEQNLHCIGFPESALDRGALPAQLSGGRAVPCALEVCRGA